MYTVSDTHALLWYLTNDKKLSNRARKFFDKVDTGELTLVISAIVLLECLDIFEKKKVVYDFQGLLLRIMHSRNIVLAAVDWHLVLEIERTEGFRDLHDRAIIAAARLFDAVLISRDAIIKRLYAKTVW